MPTGEEGTRVQTATHVLAEGPLHQSLPPAPIRLHLDSVLALLCLWTTRRVYRFYSLLLSSLVAAALGMGPRMRGREGGGGVAKVEPEVVRDILS